MKTILSTFAAAMIASASFAGVALAEGDYYQGATKGQAAVQTNDKIDNVRTGSIDQVRADDSRGDQPIFKHESRDNR
ncbi:Hypothetical protein NGAL_HAMBI2610_20770 [Neorhizobium galegae bv. orientalis]|nr:Hypothetical protein NGAL_HAMBI2610_20770 [Neorhizobium galegae bv. orientalis]